MVGSQMRGWGRSRWPGCGILRVGGGDRAPRSNRSNVQHAGRGETVHFGPAGRPCATAMLGDSSPLLKRNSGPDTAGSTQDLPKSLSDFSDVKLKERCKSLKNWLLRITR